MKNNIKSILRLVFWAVLIALGFFAGTSWRSGEETYNSSEDQPSQSYTKGETDTDEEARPNSSNSRLSPLKDELKAQELETIRLFENAAPSVCFITTSNLRIDFFSRKAMEYPAGTGSGFVWDKEGHIVTNFHVIQSADKAEVTLSDGSSWNAKVVGYEPGKDLAVLKIDAPTDKLLPIPVGKSENLQVGQSVFAIGNPFGLDQTLTTGVVSALGREIESVIGIPIRDAIQTDAAINPGNSGGPLLNSSGRLIGVNTAIYSPSGASAGIGFSIPVDVVKWVVPELIQYGQIRRPTLGVVLASQDFTRRIGLSGALILRISPNSAAEKVGLRPTRQSRYSGIELGDIIVAINDEPINSNNDLILVLEKFKEGDKVNVTVLREDREMQFEMELDPPSNR